MGVFPACAGMIPTNDATELKTTSVPRMRGDDPRIDYVTNRLHLCSPHARG